MPLDVPTQNNSWRFYPLANGVACAVRVAQPHHVETGVPPPHRIALKLKIKFAVESYVSWQQMHNMLAQVYTNVYMYIGLRSVISVRNAYHDIEQPNPGLD